MPYVAVATADREARQAAADTRWAALLSLRPDLEPAVALQRDLLTIIARLSDVLDSGRIPRLSLPSRYLAAKLTRGVPALTGEPVPVPIPVLKPALVDLCDALARGGAGDAALHVRVQIDETRIDAGSLLAASLKRDQAAIRTGATHRGLAPDLVWLIAELAVSPFAHALERLLFSAAAVTAESPLHAALASWPHGYCPLCGSWPALAEVTSGDRVLRCSFCALAWDLRDYACIYCGEHGPAFITAAPDPERKNRRLELCNTCQGYFKAVTFPALTPFPLLAIGDLETMDLDMAAMEHGYARPALKEFRHGV